MNEALMAITSAEARSAGQRLVDRAEDQRTVALAVMKAARAGFMAPDEDTAFAASVAALWELYPDDDALRQETKAVGDRTKVLHALVNGVPVNMEAALAGIAELPEAPLGLIDLWRESGGS